MTHIKTVLRRFAMVAMAGLALLALPHSTEAHTRVVVGLGVPAPVVVAPPPPVVVVRRPTFVAGRYDGYRHRHWRRGYWRHGYWGPRHHYYRWHRW